jgi:methylase of polypeptide subunit release factors
VADHLAPGIGSGDETLGFTKDRKWRLSPDADGLRGAVANELEFQGDVLKWMSLSLSARPGLGIDDVGQEKQHADRKRSDLIIWTKRDSDALAAVELKTLTTPLSDAAFQNDVIKKARRLGALFCVQWNQRETAIYSVPPEPGDASATEIFDGEPLFAFSELTNVTTKDYVGNPAIEASLEERATALLTALAQLRDTGAVGGWIVEPSIFVDWLGREVRDIRQYIAAGIQAEAVKNRSLRTQLQTWAKNQGTSRPKDEILYEQAAAQLTYRILGQSIFYLAYAGHTQGLPPFQVAPGTPLRQQLAVMWAAIREIDYEALYSDDVVLDELPMSASGENALVRLLAELDRYDWSTLDADVLGAVFERLIPVTERDLLGQFFTPPALADLIVVMCVDGSTEHVLDPACGTGEFLVRSYERLRHTKSGSHGDRLDAIWGTDISHFPTELAVINLCRQDFTTPNNFPRVLVSDFFDLAQGDTYAFPPALAGVGQGKVPVLLPDFDAIVGNPPYLRWQKLDDLDPTYRARLQKVAIDANVNAQELLDIYVLFFIRALDLVKPGGRVGFVTSNAWLATEYGVALQLLLLRDARIVAIIGSEAEPFFPQAAINTVVTVLERPPAPLAESDDYPLRFVALKKTLAEISNLHGGNRWAALDQLSAEIEGADDPFEDDVLRIRMGSRRAELAKLRDRRRVLPWTLPMRAPNLLLESMTTDYRYA